MGKTELNKEAFLNLVEVIASRAPKPGDKDVLGEDGLLYCSVCHKARQYPIKIFDEERIVPIDCDCLKAETKAQREEFRRMQNPLYREAIEARTEAQKAIRFESAEDADSKPMTAAKNFVINFAQFREMGKGLLLHGPVGTGKTYIAHCIMNELLTQGISCRMTNFAGMDGDAASRKRSIERLNRFALLVIDDLGAERNSEYMKEIVYSMIDMRSASRRPTIFTTNLSIEQIKKPLDIAEQRIYDRVLEMAFPVEVVGDSRRRKKVRDSYEQTKRLLGLEDKE